MKHFYLIIFLVVILLTSLYPQKKFDRIFIDENIVVIGEIISESQDIIKFADIESGEEISFFKKNVFKLVKANGEVIVYNEISNNSSNNASSPPLIRANPDYQYGFVEIDWLPNAINKSLLSDYVEQQDPEYHKYMYISFKGASKMEFFGLFNHVALAGKIRTAMRLLPGKYHLEIFEESGEIPVDWDREDSILEHPKNAIRRNAQKLIISYMIEVKKFQTTLIQIEREIIDASNLLISAYGLVYNKMSEPTIMYDSYVFEKFLTEWYSEDNPVIGLD